MKIENTYPKFFVIAESKINLQSFENCVQECEKNYEIQWFQNWKRRNINCVCSDVEKFPEFIQLLLKEENKNTNKNVLDYNKELLKENKELNKNILRHIYITVVFVDTSFSFVSQLKDFNGIYQVSLPNIKKINFWLPSFLENHKDIAFKIGESLVHFVDNIKGYYLQLFEKNKENVSNQKISEFLNYVLPQSVTYTSIVSGNLYNWKEFIIEHTQFHSYDESRYILMHLLRTFKMKWPSLCDDIMLCDEKDTIYSIDSLITSDSAYQKFCVKKVF